MFKADLNKELKLDHNPTEVKAFLNGAFRYYTKLYSRLWEATQEETANCEPVFFNSLNELDSQFMLVLAACKVDDPEETKKIETVSLSLDQIFTLLRFKARMIQMSLPPGCLKSAWKSRQASQ